MLKRRLSTAALAAVTALFFVVPLASAATSGLAPHRAVYAMKMLGSAEGSDISSVSGRLVIEWQGSACDGFVTSQRIVNRMGSKQGSSFVSDFRVNSWESGDGNDFNFSMTHFMNGTSIEEIEGTAQREKDGGLASLSKPEKGQIRLPASIVFPTEQIKGLVASARAGRKVHTAPVFDGSDTEHYFETTTIIGQEGSGVPEADEAEAGQNLAGLDYWPVQISYFDPSDVTGLPDYEVAFRFYENGVSTGLVMDYGDLVIGADLVSLEILPCPEC